MRYTSVTFPSVLIIRLLGRIRVLGLEVRQQDRVRIAIQGIAVVDDPDLNPGRAPESFQQRLQGLASLAVAPAQLQLFKLREGKDGVVPVDDPTEQVRLLFLERSPALSPPLVRLAGPPGHDMPPPFGMTERTTARLPTIMHPGSVPPAKKAGRRAEGLSSHAAGARGAYGYDPGRRLNSQPVRGAIASPGRSRHNRGTNGR